MPVFAALFRLFAAFIFVTASLSSASSASERLDYDLVYHVQWGDSHLGKALAKWQMDDSTYRFEGSVKTEGTLAIFYEFEGMNSLEGERQGNQFRPSQFQSESTYDDETYIVDMSWPKGIKTPIFTVEPEPEQDEIHPLRKASLRNVVDPYTAMLMALSDLEASGQCNGKYRVFDGRRRSELHLKDFGTTTLSADEEGAYSGEAHICGSASKLIGGHKLDSDYDPEEELDFEKVKIFIGRVNGDRLIPVRIEMTGFLGSIIARLHIQSSTFR